MSFHPGRYPEIRSLRPVELLGLAFYAEPPRVVASVVTTQQEICPAGIETHTFATAPVAPAVYRYYPNGRRFESGPLA